MPHSRVGAVGPPAKRYFVGDRALSIQSDDTFVDRFVELAYCRLRACPTYSYERAPNRGEIFVHGGSSRLLFNGEEVAWPSAASDERTPFIAAFYGSHALFRLAAGSVESCWAFYGAAVQVGTGAVVIVGRSGIGKTTLVLELMARGAGFYSDECVFLDKADASVGGLPRALMIREPALERLSSIPAVAEACRRLPFYATARGRLWYAIDPAEIFDATAVAGRSPLRAFVVLDDEWSASASVSSIATSVGAVELARRCHTKRGGIGAVAEISRRLRSVQCYRLRLGAPGAAADLLYRTCSSA